MVSVCLVPAGFSCIQTPPTSSKALLSGWTVRRFQVSFVYTKSIQSKYIPFGYSQLYSQQIQVKYDKTFCTPRWYIMVLSNVKPHEMMVLQRSVRVQSNQKIQPGTPASKLSAAALDEASTRCKAVFRRECTTCLFLTEATSSCAEQIEWSMESDTENLVNSPDTAGHVSFLRKYLVS